MEVLAKCVCTQAGDRSDELILLWVSRTTSAWVDQLV